MANADDRQTPEPAPLNPGAKIAEVRPSKRAVYVAIVLLTIPATILLLALADALGNEDPACSFRGTLLALALFVPLGAVHELLHAGAALVFGRVRPQDLRLGICWRAGALMCHIKAPIRVGAARIVGLAPLVVTGPIVLALFLWRPSQVTVLLTVFAILGCAMDVVMVARLRGFSDDMLIVDLASEPGFDVYASPHTTQAIDGELRPE
jgi:hypothetical protein